MCGHVVLEEGMEIPAKIWSLSFIVPILGGGKKNTGALQKHCLGFDWTDL